MNLQLKNKFALVIGSIAGIGFDTAKALAAKGAGVIVNGRIQTRVAEVISAIVLQNRAPAFAPATIRHQRQNRQNSRVISQTAFDCDQRRWR